MRASTIVSSVRRGCISRNVELINGRQLRQPLDIKGGPMSEIIEGLVGQFERGQLTRRELVLSLSALVLGGREAAGQSSARAIPVSTLNHVTFRVSDVQRSVEFYQRIFGMPLMTTQGDPADPSLYVLRIGDGPQAIMLGQSATPDIDHFCLGMEGFDAERVTRTLAEHGVEASIRHRDDSDPPAQELMIRDPDGIRVQIQDVSYCGGSGVLGNMCDPADRPR
jgi:catechol 2,3-dioxygenase-like lactoylglutathione lyase family enzyme